MSLYAEYIKERRNHGCLETEDGFATFEYVTDKIVYIIDLYVVPSKRKSNIASNLADEICRVAKEAGKTQLLGSVDLQSIGAQDSIKVLLAYGMKISHAEKNALYFIKDI
jgi:acetyltransferase (GNAT) family protein